MKRKKFILFGGVFLLVGLLASNCGASRDVVYPKEYIPRSKPTPLPKDLQKLWDNRHEKQDLAQALKGLEELYKQNPGDYDVMLKLCTGNYLMADGHLYLEITPQNEKAKKKEQEEYFDAAVKWCERAMATNEAFYRAVTGGTPFIQAIPLVTKNEIEALYWKYAALAKWSRLKGLMTLLENKATFSAIIDRVEQLDKDFFHAAVLRYRAAANFASPTGNKKEGHEQFAKAFKIAPNYFGGKVLYVDLALRGDEEKATKLLNEVINGNPNAIPDIRSEQIIEQRKAKKLLDEILN